MTMVIHLSTFNHINKYEEFTPADVHIETIAGNLSRICRFAGACGRFYSVAQHSLVVRKLVEGDVRLEKLALLHDAHEAYIGDIIRPVLVRIEHIDAIPLLKGMLDRNIFGKFRMTPTQQEKDSITFADQLALQIEQLVFFRNYTFAEQHSLKPQVEMITEMLQTEMTPREAEAAFLEAWKNV